jgi:hypothetical protein
MIEFHGPGNAHCESRLWVGAVCPRLSGNFSDSITLRSRCHQNAFLERCPCMNAWSPLHAHTSTAQPGWAFANLYSVGLYRLQRCYKRLDHVKELLGGSLFHPLTIANYRRRHGSRYPHPHPHVHLCTSRGTTVSPCIQVFPLSSLLSCPW